VDFGDGGKGADGNELSVEAGEIEVEGGDLHGVRPGQGRGEELIHRAYDVQVSLQPVPSRNCRDPRVVGEERGEEEDVEKEEGEKEEEDKEEEEEEEGEEGEEGEHGKKTSKLLAALRWKEGSVVTNQV